MRKENITVTQRETLHFTSNFSVDRAIESLVETDLSLRVHNTTAGQNNCCPRTFHDDVKSAYDGGRRFLNFALKIYHATGRYVKYRKQRSIRCCSHKSSYKIGHKNAIVGVASAKDNNSGKVKRCIQFPIKGRKDHFHFEGLTSQPPPSPHTSHKHSHRKYKTY
jgi:hypothetical protein